jgi:hypothetical protein
MTRFKLLTATARLSVIIATSVLAQVIQGHCAYAFDHMNGNAGIDSTPTRARDVTGISRETSGTSGAASAPWAMAGNETPDRGQRRSATASRMRPIILHQVPRQPLSSFSTKKTRSSTARSKASAEAANAGGAKGPYFWCAFEDGEVTVIGDGLPDKIRNLQRKTVIYTENGKGGMGGSLLRFSPLDGPPQPCCPQVAQLSSGLLSHSKLGGAHAGECTCGGSVRRV